LYEDKNGSQRIESMDNGLTWTHYEYSGAGLMSKSIKKIMAKDGIPVQLLGCLGNEFTERYFKGLQMSTTTDVILLESNVPFPEKNPIPQSRIILAGIAQVTEQ
jgi:transcriptional regulator of met regulon